MATSKATTTKLLSLLSWSSCSMTPVVVDEIRCVRLQTEEVEVRVTAVLAALDVVGSGAVVVVDVDDVARVAGALAADGVQPNDLTAPPRPRCAQPGRESQTRVKQNEKGTHAATAAEETEA